MERLSCANNAFALELYRALSATSAGGNVFFSPLSIRTALAMVYLGARGDTATEMAKALSFGSVSDVHTHFQAHSSEINAPSASYILKLANRLYGEKTFNFLSEFLEATQKLYHADLTPVDFIGAVEETRQLINSWVEQQTESKIKDLLKPGMVTAKTRLALVNAVYFKGGWQNIFNSKNTKEMPFKINQNESRPVQMMYQKTDLPFKYIPEYSLQVVELPYVQQELSMFLLLPEETRDGSDPLHKLERELTVAKLRKWTDRANMESWTEVVLHLPRFKLEEEYSLKTALAGLGMATVFEADRADLSGMSGERGLFLSAVAHKAFVDVNEVGTEAAAATAAMARFCMSRVERHVMADHPFLFFIRHNKTNSILFLGRFSCPP